MGGVSWSVIKLKLLKESQDYLEKRGRGRYFKQFCVSLSGKERLYIYT